MSPTMILKGVRATNNEAFQLRVDRLYANTDWRRVQRAFDQHTIVCREHREQMVSLMGSDWGMSLDMRYPNGFRCRCQTGQRSRTRCSQVTIMSARR